MPPATILDGRSVAADLWSDVEAAAKALADRSHIRPQLAVLRVGEDPASAAYSRQISRAFTAHGFLARTEALPETSDQATVAATLAQLALDPAVHGVLLQLPLPAALSADALIETIPLAKDVEGIHPYHVGRLALRQPGFVPSTPQAGIELLRRTGVGLTGRTAVVIGRSPIVGRPMAILLLHADCTVIVCHSRTPDLSLFTRQADILVAAAGRAGLLRGDMLKPGAVVIDFGTNEVDGRLVGDVDFESACSVAGAITPVPGGTGPVTTAVLGRNVLQAARAQSTAE